MHQNPPAQLLTTDPDKQTIRIRLQYILYYILPLSPYNHFRASLSVYFHRRYCHNLCMVSGIQPPHLSSALSRTFSNQQPCDPNTFPAFHRFQIPLLFLPEVRMPCRLILLQKKPPLMFPCQHLYPYRLFHPFFRFLLSRLFRPFCCCHQHLCLRKNCTP